MSIWKIVSGILSILLCGYAVVQAFLAKGLQIIHFEGGIAGSANLIAAALLLVGGIVAIASRDSFSNIGNIVLILLYGAGAAVGYLFAGVYSDLLIGATWCVLCAVMAAVAIAADNICDAWVYILLFVLGIGLAAAGILINLHNTGKTLPEFLQDSIPQIERFVKSGSKAEASGGGEPDETEPGESGPDKLDADAEGIQEPSANTGNMPSIGDLGDYHVEIKGAALGEDREGAPVIIVTYTWTNNSDRTTNASISTEEKAFQDGEELEHVFSIDKDAYPYDPSHNTMNVRPGESVDVQCAFALASSTPAVAFEITEWLTTTDEKVTAQFDMTKL